MQIVVLPGLHGTSPLYSDFLEALPASIEPRALNYPLDNYPQYDQILPLVLAQLPPGRFVVLGDSYSGPLALMLARDLGDRVAGVVLSATFVTNPIRPIFRAARLLAYGPFVALLPVRPLAAAFLVNGIDRPALIDRIARDVGAVHPSILAGRMRAAIDGDHRAILRSCAVPLLHLRPRNDRVISERAAGVISHVRPDTDIAVLDAGHAQLMSHPAHAAEAVAAFIDARVRR